MSRTRLVASVLLPFAVGYAEPCLEARGVLAHRKAVDIESVSSRRK